MSVISLSELETKMLIADTRQTVLYFERSAAQSRQYNQKAWEILQFAKDYLSRIKRPTFIVTTNHRLS